MEIIELAAEKPKPEFNFKEARASGKVIFETDDLVIGYDEPLTKPINVRMERGEKIALVGANGIGKTTLLKSILGLIQPLSGKVHLGDYQYIGYFEQEGDYKNTTTCIEELWQEYPGLDQREIRAALAKCGLTTKHIESQVRVLSGGEQAKVRLCKLVNRETNILLLDEPTNHLDVDAIMWLETYLANYRGSLLLVTHDRYFLERVTNQMLEIKNGGIESYSGNYLSYLEQKAEREAIQQKMSDKQAKLYKNELAWMRKGAKARTSKQQARIHRFEDLEKGVKETQGEDQNLEINFDSSRLGKRVFQLEDVSLEVGEKTILEHFRHIFQASDRIGIVGINGSGKTTFLRMLAGHLEPASGILTVGETVKIGYYRQIMEPFPEDKRVINYLQEIAEEAQAADGTRVSVTELLETFLFPREMHGSLIRTLSGGERRRLYLLKLLMNQPNVLLFDEPTNDLDIETLTVLEDYLTSFPGAALVVSHDRYFLDKVVDKLIVIDGPAGPFLFYGNMTDYLEVADELYESIPVAKVEKSKVADSETVEKRKLTYSEQLEWAGIEDEIMVIDEEIAEAKEQMLEISSDFVKLGEAQEQLEAKEALLAAKWERYEYLSQFAGQ